MSHRPASRSERPDPRVLRPVRQLALAGLALPLGLVGMPMLAWWSLHRFALPSLAARGARRGAPRRRGPQAQRRRSASRTATQARAA
ncbi:hypothetical protein [Xanthomonas phaseoli]|uniref:hypothetical protein n=1 Tax=Xanthomonas phaseoli TaxID=1985254 RepID=UPI0002FAD296|nr:hypothetical protein [Xanthomonas phaseoli]